MTTLAGLQSAIFFFEALRLSLPGNVETFGFALLKELLMAPLIQLWCLSMVFFLAMKQNKTKKNINVRLAFAHNTPGKDRH